MKSLSYCIAALNILLLATCALASPKYVVIPISVPANTSCLGFGINNACQITGTMYYSDNSAHAFVWSGGNLTLLLPSSTLFSEGYGINESGHAVGIADFSDGTHAFLWKNGKTTDLGYISKSFASSDALGINDKDEAVGELWTNSFPSVSNAFLDHAGSMMNLGHTGKSSSASGINNQGQIAGTSELTGQVGLHAVMWQGSSIINLGSLGGSFSGAVGINNFGNVAGNSDVNTTNSTTEHAFFWQNGKMTDITPNSVLAEATAINDLNQVVGNFVYNNDPDFAEHGFTWRADEGMADLNNLIESGSGWEITRTTAINDHGWILASAQSQNDPNTDVGVILAPMGKPTNVRLSPSNGTLKAGSTYTFTTVYSDPDGATDLRYSYFAICKNSDLTNAVYVLYDQSANKLYLRNAADTSWLGGFTPGAGAIIDSDICKLYCNRTSVSKDGTNLTITWSIGLKSPLLGTCNGMMFDRDYLDLRGGWDTKGSFTITK